MKRYFMTDIHGDARGMKALLDHVGIDFSVDQIVFGGDMINRGKDSAEVVKFVKNLVDTFPNNVHAVVGNHEEMLSDYYRSGDKTWLHHGGSEALKNFNKTFTDDADRQSHLEWATSLPLLFEDEAFVYTHAGLNPHEPLNKQSREILWMSESVLYSIPGTSLLALTQNKPIIHGHTPVEYIYFDGVRLNCDLGSNTYSIEEERGLGLVNLTEMTYFIYKQAQKKIEKRKVVQI
ncbi:metallophosphoesterase family protein [Paenibacillus vini]|uniref:Serine/threonine protein phosphatase n=1 Tax=Paenibacillus vini TaxID=1476024 RepID=A0ABQ4MAB5_9BACL|nr:metallophosphoesterase family protein [Paenibacillus vini]GIP52938.1 serine/threonine protein phosphatase [Paenibacillus vini]